MAMTDLLQFTINVRKSHCRPQCTLQRMLKIMCHLSELIFTLLCAAAASKMRVSSVSCVATFLLVNWALHPTPQTKNHMNSTCQIQTFQDYNCLCGLVSLTVTDTIASHSFDLSS